jgi:hypothetical protein
LCRASSWRSSGPTLAPATAAAVTTAVTATRFAHLVLGLPGCRHDWRGPAVAAGRPARRPRARADRSSAASRARPAGSAALARRMETSFRNLVCHERAVLIGSVVLARSRATCLLADQPPTARDVDADAVVIRNEPGPAVPRDQARTESGTYRNPVFPQGFSRSSRRPSPVCSWLRTAPRDSGITCSAATRRTVGSSACSPSTLGPRFGT